MYVLFLRLGIKLGGKKTKQNRRGPWPHETTFKEETDTEQIGGIVIESKKY